ncbi:uncharacterized protein LOC135643821 [Musa acuminata AAA Group]|uniref:uncharacterized protein LOC135643821 n=1 Tax=Musa acuminata AAA Group TaxID=214697 RepID=UPI0031CFFB90
MQVDAIYVLPDSQLVVEHLNDGYKARDPTMSKYLAEVKSLTVNFSRFTLSRVPRSENERADALAKLASKSDPEAQPEVEELPFRAIAIAAVSPADLQTTWVQEMLRYKRDGILLTDKVAARRLRRTQAWYSEMNGRLYKRYLYENSKMRDVTGSGRGPRRDFWGTHRWANLGIQDPSPRWELDLLGPFPLASGKRRYIVVGVDYFTKIQPRFSSLAHPQTNGLAEVTNRSILDELRRRAFVARLAWVDELPSILWSLRTTPKTAIGESPHSLAFRTEAVLPPEVVFPNPRMENYEERITIEGLQAGLNMLEEWHADTRLKALSYKRTVSRIYNWKVHSRSIKLGDLVLRKVEVSDPTRAHGKLAPN